MTTVDNLCSDLLNWRTLYLAGRMHKPIRIIKDDARVRLTQQVNLISAVRAALLTLPDTFSETELFARIAGFSYAGDVRMLLPAENRAKVDNIVRAQSPQFRELYHRLAVALPGVHWSPASSTIHQDVSPHARAAHLRKLPSHLLARVTAQYARPDLPPREADEGVYWARIAGDNGLADTIHRGESPRLRPPAGCMLMRAAPRNPGHRPRPVDRPEPEGRRQRRPRQEHTLRDQQGAQVESGVGVRDKELMTALVTASAGSGHSCMGICVISWCTSTRTDTHNQVIETLASSDARITLAAQLHAY